MKFSKEPNWLHLRRRRGLAIVYLAISLVTLTAICSLAVDFGRWELCKTELQRASDAAARAGALQLATSYTGSVSQATAVVNANYVDGKTIASNSSVTASVQMLQWTNSSNYTVLAPANYSSANAVRVTLTYSVPLTFGSVIGISSKNATRSSTAMIVINSQNVYVGANGDIWLSGEPTGTLGSEADPGYKGLGVNPLHPYPNDIAGPIGGTTSNGERYSSPAQVSIPITAGSVITVSNVSGTGTHDPSLSYATANGVTGGSTEPVYDDGAANGVSEHGIADTYMPLDAMLAVFLGSALPDNSAAPPVLNFSTASSQDYTNLAPQLKQPFYVGYGQTAGGNQQTIVVPQGATRLFFGMMDGWEWDNNAGGYNATITEYSVQMVQ